MDDKPAESDNREEADARDQSRARITTQPVFGGTPEHIDVDSLLAKVPPGALGLFIVNSGDLILAQSIERITLGRRAEDAGTSISVDGLFSISPRFRRFQILQGYKTCFIGLMTQQKWALPKRILSAKKFETTFFEALCKKGHDAIYSILCICIDSCWMCQLRS